MKIDNPEMNVCCRSVVLGYQSIVAGDSKVVLCGGQESMSRAPHSVYMRASNKMGDATLKDTLIFDGLTDAFHDIHMGITGNSKLINIPVLTLLIMNTILYNAF